MSAVVRAVRGATTIDADDQEQIRTRTIALIDQLITANDLDHEDLISVILTATKDIHSMFPAQAAREYGLGDVPLLCARELDIDGATPLCIRILLHVNTDRARSDLHHVYLEGASNLRDDLPS